MYTAEGGGGMEIYYRGRTGSEFARIDSMVLTRKCVTRDTCGQRCDSLEIEFENAAGWYAWGPEEDDEIIVRQDGYDSGLMFLHTILPEDGKFRILATALPCAARKKEYRSYRDKTVEDILRACALRTGMSFQAFGIDAKITVPYIEQENESAAAFLYRLLKLEGAELKCVNGNYTAIGLEYAQDRAARQTIRLDAQQRGLTYRRNGVKLKNITIKTPWAEGNAEDLMVPDHHTGLTISGLPAMDNIQAARWARNILRHCNLEGESLVMGTEFNPGLTALTRIDVTGDTDASGEWLITDVEHDLYNKTSRATLRRCVGAVQ